MNFPMYTILCCMIKIKFNINFEHTPPNYQSLYNQVSSLVTWEKRVLIRERDNCCQINNIDFISSIFWTMRSIFQLKMDQDPISNTKLTQRVYFVLYLFVYCFIYLSYNLFDDNNLSIILSI